MLVVDNMILQTTVQDILLELRYQLTINGNSLLSVMKDSNDDIMITCPFHKDGREKTPSCGVSKKNGVCHCFTCGYSATLSEMISNVFGYNDYGVFGKNWLRKNFTEIAVEERDDISIDLNRKDIKKQNYTYVPEMVLDQFRYTHPYIHKRGITDNIIEMFDIGYDKETDCVTFPVRDIHGNCLFVARRSVTGKYFNYPAGAHKPLYGLYELSQMNIRTEVFICESIFNALSLWSIGYPALALNGTGSKDQLEELKRLPVRSLVLALDNDEAGIKGSKRIADAMFGYKLLYKVDYKDSRDINDLLLAGELEDTVSTISLVNNIQIM